MEVIVNTKRERAVLVSALRDRDGDFCMYPDCDKKDKMNFDLTESPWFVTLDHTMPQSVARESGWTEDQIWALDNLSLYHKRCNALKGNRVPLHDGSLPPLPRESKEKAADKSNRTMVCNTCESGRLLLFGEECSICGSGPQPAVAPAYLKRNPKDCDHSQFHCFMCWTGMIPRRSAINVIITGP